MKTPEASMYLVFPSKEDKIYAYDDLNMIKIHVYETNDLDIKVFKLNNTGVAVVYEPFDLELNKKYSIDNLDLEVTWQDEGPWRSYQLSASGNSFQEMLEDAGIAEVDQDGGDLSCYGLEETHGEIYEKAILAINQCIQKRRDEDEKDK